MNYFGLVNRILDIAGSHDYVFETYYGDVYEFENSGTRKYANVVLTPTQSVDSGDYTTYTFTLFATDRLTDDKSNKVAVQSHCKSILTGILDKLCETGDVTLSSATFYYWTEKFNDLCGGCYATFSVSLPREEICVDDVLPVVTKKITSNGLYDVRNVDEVEVYIPQIPTQSKTIILSENDKVVEILPDDGYTLDRVEISTNIKVFSVRGIRQLASEYAGDLPYIFDFTGLTSANQFASNCSKLTSIGGVVNTGSVKDMQYMFRNCSSLATLDVSKLDTSKVTNMYYMFRNCSSLATLDVSEWDTSKVTNMASMFGDCSSLATLDVSEWDTSKVTNMEYMFAFTALKELDLHKWDVSNLATMPYLLRSSAIERIDMHGWNTSSLTVTSMSFAHCSNLSWIDMTDWKDCSNFLPEYDFHGNYKYVITLIGDHTLAEVEAGNVSLYKNCGKKDGTLKWASWQFSWTYASMLAMCQGLYDRTGLTANTISLPKATFNNCYNDDRTIPDTDTIASRQATIRAILAAKNYTLTIY